MPQKYRPLPSNVVGTLVRLMEQPDGCVSQHAPVTVGETYRVESLMGSCLVITTDVPDVTASIGSCRFEPASPVCA